MIHYRSGERRITAEIHPPGEKILILEVERRCHQARDVNLRAGAEYDAVGIDQEYPAIRLQRAKYARRIDTDHAVEHRARRRLLDEARRLVGADRELLPVDDGARSIGDRQQIAPRRKRDLAVDVGDRHETPARVVAKLEERNVEERVASLPVFAYTVEDVDFGWVPRAS